MDAKVIPLTRGHVAIVDAEDYKRLAQHNWYADRQGRTLYAARTLNGRNLYMHRALLNPPDGLVVDHINHNGLDNRRSNIRVVTRSENAKHLPPAPKRSKLSRMSHKQREEVKAARQPSVLAEAA